jgi:hypothetical protein
MPDLTPPAQCVRASVPGLSVLTLGELRKGIESMTDIGRRARLAEWMETELPLFFSGRILAVDQQVAPLGTYGGGHWPHDACSRQLDCRDRRLLWLERRNAQHP